MAYCGTCEMAMKTPVAVVAIAFAVAAVNVAAAVLVAAVHAVDVGASKVVAVAAVAISCSHHHRQLWTDAKFGTYFLAIAAHSSDFRPLFQVINYKNLVTTIQVSISTAELDAFDKGALSFRFVSASLTGAAFGM
eukprot:gene2574-biopygen2113